jgi:hypothetical protein
VLTVRTAVYSAIQVWSETGLGRTEEAVSYLDNMAKLEQSGTLVEDVNEAKWIVDSLQRIVDRDAPDQVRSRAESLITAINERLMSQYPLGTSLRLRKEDILQEAADYMRTLEHERVQRQPEPQNKDEQLPMSDEDEMAATAGRLLERVADNTSEKFQNSQFLQLMRQLRDREVRVEEDKIVQVNEQTSAPSQQQPLSTKSQQRAQQQISLQQQAEQARQPSQIPPIDSAILTHAALDFDTPSYPQDTEQEQYAASPMPREPIVITDEISDQFRSYNSDVAYL